ncbi:MAG: hypothetical protein E6I76_16260, partial [Chloroflexi bacterium]
AASGPAASGPAASGPAASGPAASGPAAAGPEPPPPHSRPTDERRARPRDARPDQGRASAASHRVAHDRSDRRDGGAARQPRRPLASGAARSLPADLVDAGVRLRPRRHLRRAPPLPP